MIRRYFFIFMLGAFLLPGCAGMNSAFFRQQPAATALDLVLRELFLERRDFTAVRDIGQEKPLLLQRAACFLSSPLQAVSFSRDAARRFFRDAESLASLALVCADLMELEIDLPDIPGPGRETGLGDAVDRLYGGLCFSMVQFQEAFADLADDERHFLKQRFEEVLFQGIRKDDITRKHSQDITEKAFSMASQIDRTKMMGAFCVLAAVLDHAVLSLADDDPLHKRPRTVHTPHGDIVIGGTGDDSYDGEMPLILIEPGGDDTYRFTGSVPFSVIIDMAGDDAYVPARSCFLGSGVLGIGALVDCEGDDVYRGGHFSFGCGFLGAGLLADYKGNDQYDAGALCQGAGAFGMGLLFDGQGDDTYKSIFYSQGMGYVGGGGFLVDTSGDDSFVSGLGVPDAREKSGAFQTYSQGFGLGCRMYAPGGIGILYDETGNDRYEGSYFCQGSSYWYAVGALIDEQGNDRYAARRYAQGAGVHFSTGILADNKGNDTYTSWGVSQGCGHDYAVGMLLDRKGDDAYDAAWLSQGAGNSRGIGLLLDDCGDDRYAAKKEKNTQGSGVYDPRRDAPSIGILIDGTGTDSLSEGYRKGGLWSKGDVGGGFDGEGGLRLVWHDSPAGCTLKRTETAENAGPDVQKASRSERLLPELEAPLFLEASWKEAAGSLAAQGPGVIPALLQYLDIKDISVLRAIEETFKLLGKEYLEDIHAALDIQGVDSNKRRYLLFVLSEIASSASRDLFLESLHDEESTVQAMALRGLYKLGAHPPLALSFTLSSSGSSAVRRYLCLCLDACSDQGALEILTELLVDKDRDVRYAAARTLRNKGPASLPFLRALHARENMPPSVGHLVETLIASAQYVTP